MNNPFKTIDARLSNIETLLLDIKHTPKSSSVSEIPKYFGAKECCKILGITLPTLYLYTSQRKIPHSKQGKRLIFDKDEVLNWIKSGRIRTKAEIQKGVTL